MQEHLSHRHGGHFAFGELWRPVLGLDARARISARLDGMRPALLLKSNTGASIPVLLSDSSDLDRASATLHDIPGDDDAEPFTTFDEYDDARSETRSISSLRALKSSFYRIASASVESFTSVQSILGPSFGTRNMSIHQLVKYMQSRHRLSKTSILNMTTYHSRSLTNHKFVVFQLRQGRRDCWLRLDRRAEDPLSASFIFSGMQGPAKDEVCHILFLHHVQLVMLNNNGITTRQKRHRSWKT